MKKDYMIGQEGLAIVEKINEETQVYIEPKKARHRQYKEGVFYGCFSLLAVSVVGLITMIGCISYLTMNDESYYTTDYKGDVRVLTPLAIEER